MKQRRPSQLAAGIAAALCIWATPALARINGIATSSCEGCHGSGGTVTVDAPSSIEPGDQVTLTVTVTGPNIQGGGFFISNQQNDGTFSLIDGEGTKLNGNGVSHSTRKNASGGAVTFRVNWTAPNVVGASRFSVAGVAANADGTPGGDHAGATTFDMVYGCTGQTVYRDYDGDGYGSDLVTAIACGPSALYSDKGGDCNENDASIHPGAPEVCNQVDDNCNGLIDEGLEGVTIYRDADGDGYGVPTETAIGCGTRPGFAGNADDCDDTDPLVHPKAGELCNGRDDNCDGNVDEGLIQTCGVGSCLRSAESCFISECIPGDPTPEVCNGLDDDCNGATDDGDICPRGQACIDALCVPVASDDGAVGPPPSSGGQSSGGDGNDDEADAAVEVGGSSGQAGAPANSAGAAGTTSSAAGSGSDDGKTSGSSGGGCEIGTSAPHFEPMLLLGIAGVLLGGRRGVRRRRRVRKGFDERRR